MRSPSAQSLSVQRLWALPLSIMPCIPNIYIGAEQDTLHWPTVFPPPRKNAAILASLPGVFTILVRLDLLW